MATAEAQQENKGKPQEYIAPEPYLGQTLLWYPHANPRNAAVPGVCNSVDGNGIVSIATLKKNHSTLETHIGVRHISDPHHLKRTEATLVRGGWDFTEGDKIKMGLPLEPTPEEALVLKIYDQMKASDGDVKATDVAAKVTEESKKQWSHQRVNGVLRKFKRE